MKHLTELTETEWDLIETVRNYKRSFPNGEPRLRYYITHYLQNFWTNRSKIKNSPHYSEGGGPKKERNTYGNNDIEGNTGWHNEG